MPREKSAGLTDMTVGNPLRHIIRFSIPLLIGNLFQQFYNMADSIIVGQFMGEERVQAQAAVNNGMPVIMLITAVFMGLGMGATIILSQNYGAKEMDAVRKTIRTIYTVVMTVSVPLTVVGVAATPALMRLLGVPDASGTGGATTMDMAVGYVRIIFIGLIGSLGYNINAGILQGLGDSRTPLRFLIVSTLINVVLDLLFVAVFGWGVTGVAVATIIAQAFSWLYGAWYIRKKYPELELRLLKLGADRPILQKILRLGLPSAVQQSLFSVGSLMMQKLVNEGGDAFIAGFGNAVRIDSFVFLPVFSFFAALTTFAGQNMGMRQIARVKHGLRVTLCVAQAVYAVMAVLTVVFGRFLLGLFNPDQAVIDNGMIYIYSVIPFCFIVIFQFMMVAVMRGAGQVMVPLFTTVVGFIIVRIPSAYLLARFAGHDKMFYSYPIGWCFSLAAAGVMYATGRWQHKSLVMNWEPEG
ncbi:MAG: MATE family efflux transporter [Oscillospiraceae bacterium]|jgi:putative MATE family efflux protein|nr:MATE family efflux transporter [Oscillospiraceae bacterium]